MTATLALEPPSLTARWLGEPLLGFAAGVEHEDPKVGIPYAGPRSSGTPRHRDPINVGFVGTAEGVEVVHCYLEQAAHGVDGDEGHHPFPGFLPDRGFRTSIRSSDAFVATITAAERRSIMEKGKRQRPRFEELLEVLDDRVRHLADADAPIDLVVIALPDDMARRCGTAKYRDGGKLIHRDLHAAFKARCMR